MEEIDKIIIESLNNLNCGIGNDIESLKHFDPDMVVNAIATCLQSIQPEHKFPKKLPASMSQKLKVAIDLSQEIKNLGFKGDMGYQSILYSNDIEIRRVLMFLIERLPRDEANKSLQIVQTGYAPRLLRKIEDNLRLYEKQLWIPASLLHFGVRECSEGYLVHSLGNSTALQSINLIIPNSADYSDEMKQYFVHIVPDVTKQCSNSQLIPSLLFNDCKFDKNEGIFNLLRNSQPLEAENEAFRETDAITSAILNQTKEPIRNNSTVNENIQENNLKALVETVREEQNILQELSETKKRLEQELIEVKERKTDEENALKNIMNKIKLKKQTIAVISNENNLVKLKKKVDEANEHLIDLANKWNEIQTPLLEEYWSLQNTLSKEQLSIQKEEEKFQNVKSLHKNLENDLKEKELLEESLIKKCQQTNNSNNRSHYTRRILEIIGNIKKQNDEIQKILNDTKDVQKDINNLTGQVDRSFTLADEIIFSDAKHDETARKAYKLLAALRDECNAVLKTITDLGLTERETRNLQEQIETESAKEIAIKLEQVTKDIEEIRKESQILMK